MMKRYRHGSSRKHPIPRGVNGRETKKSTHRGCSCRNLERPGGGAQAQFEVGGMRRRGMVFQFPRCLGNAWPSPHKPERSYTPAYQIGRGHAERGRGNNDGVQGPCFFTSASEPGIPPARSGSLITSDKASSRPLSRALRIPADPRAGFAARYTPRTSDLFWTSESPRPQPPGLFFGIVVRLWPGPGVVPSGPRFEIALV